MKRNLPETDTNGALPEQSKEHPAAKKKTDVLLDLIRDGRPMTLRQQLRLTVELSVPAIIAQLSSIIMQYIDAAMVGRIGAEASASIGLVSTTTWLFWGLCTAAATGFSVQVAHKVGAGDLKGATYDSAAVTCRHTGLQSAAGHIGREHQLLTAGMAGRRCFHPSGCFHLFLHIFYFPACPANDFSGRRYAAL